MEITKLAQTSKEFNVGGVSLSFYDENEQLKSTYDILAELYPQWQSLNNEQKSAIGIALAGKTQYEVLSATMNGYGNVIEANTIALTSQGSAMEENSKYMDSLGAKIYRHFTIEM